MPRKKRKNAPLAGVPAATAVPSSPPAGEGSTEVVRDDSGRWVAGQSGNPAGKIKGLRNHLTLERIALEGALREYIAAPDNLEKLKQGIDRILEIAISGEDKQAVAAFKVLADKVMTAPKDTAEGEQQGPNTVTVFIENLTTQGKKEAPLPAVTVEYQDVEEEK